MMNISEELLDKISIEQGASFYLLDSNTFKDNYRNLIKEFRQYYAKTNIAYSYKTNYVPRYCEIVHELGGFAEVVSSMEMDLALKLGVKAKDIFFNGPYKDIEHVVKLLEMGGTVNIDSINDLDNILPFADKHTGSPFRLGIRCNFDIYDNTTSRFGIDINSSDFQKAIDIIDKHKNLKIVGLHCHYPNRVIESWRNRTLGMISVLEKYFKNRLTDIEEISLGGGIYGVMSEVLRKQFAHNIPDFSDYAYESARVIEEFFKTQNTSHRPLLIIEPGTALVANALQFVASVYSIKAVRGKSIITLTGSGYNINPNPNRKNVPITRYKSKVSRNFKQVRNANFAGYTCIENDYLYRDYTGEIGVGDYIVFQDVGSYSVVMKPPFILPNVAVVEPTKDNNYILIKHKESFDDIFKTYVF